MRHALQATGTYNCENVGQGNVMNGDQNPSTNVWFGKTIENLVDVKSTGVELFNRRDLSLWRAAHLRASRSVRRRILGAMKYSQWEGTT